MNILERMDRAEPIMDRPPRPSRRRRAADGAIAGLGLAGLVHTAWAAGSTWPVATKDELADLVVGVRPFPSAAMTLGVVASIGAGAGLVLLESRRLEGTEASRPGGTEASRPGGTEASRPGGTEVSRPECTEENRAAEALPFARRMLRVGAWGVVGVLALRGGGGLVVSAFRLGQVTDLFRYWDLRIYSPLCVGLAALSFLAIRPPSIAGSDPARADPAQ